MKGWEALIFVVSVTTFADMHRVRLRKIEPEWDKQISEGLSPKYMKGKDVNRTAADYFSHSVSRVTNYGDVQYVAEVTVGTPEQRFRVVMDTGCADFYVPDVSCRKYQPKKCDNPKCNAGLVCKVFCPEQSCCVTTLFSKRSACDNGDLFNATASTSYVKMEGKWSVKRGIDGVLGLAFPVIASSRITPPLSRAIQLDLVYEPIFTVYLGPVNGKGEGHDGIITYGAVDRDHCGPIIAYEPLTTPTHWQFKLIAVTSGNFHARQTYKARSDTGSSFIGAPVEEANEIAREHGAEWDDRLQHYIIDCAAQPTLVFTIGDQNYTIQAENLVASIPGGHCLLRIQASANERYGPTWKLGIRFHRQYCTIHDFAEERIGFAEPKS